jgi:hypothetical protein
MELLTPVKHPRVTAAERLEAEISELAGQLAAATCRFLLLVAEFDRLDGWVGHRSCAQWLSWRCGLSPSAAREHVRVAHALEEWPIIREAFAAGRLSYSKVRAITRVAHRGNEAELVQTAQVTTAAQLDRIVRAMRTATRQQVRDRHHRRTLTWRWDDDGMLVLTARLDPDEGAVALAALRAAESNNLRPEADDANPEEARASAPTDASAGARSTTGSAMGAAEPVGASAGARSTTGSATWASDPADASAEARSTTRSATRAAGPVGASAGARSASGPAEARAAVPADASAGARSVGGSAEPGVGSGGCGGPEGSAMTAVDSFVAIMTSYLGSAARDATDADAYQVIVLADALTSSDAGRADRPDADDGKQGGMTDDGTPLPRDTVARIACTAAVVHATVSPDGTPMDVGRKTRKVSASLRRALRIRDSGRCRFPGCTARRRLHSHHLRHWADGGETTLANLVSLCPAHHWAVHEGGHHAWIDESHRLRFARPDGRPLETAPSMEPADADLTTDEDITPETIVPDWDGTPLDLANAVLALLQPACGRGPAGRPAA